MKGQKKLGYQARERSTRFLPFVDGQYCLAKTFDGRLISVYEKE